MRPDYIIIDGFMIFADRQELDLSVFESNSIIGILGENLDSVGGYDSNASGKSSFINAISWVFFDRIAIQSEGKLTKDEVINDYAKKASVELGFHDENTGDVFIIRNEKTKSKNTFNLWINDEIYITNTDTLRREKLYSILGFGGKSKSDFRDFLNSFYFTGESTKSFASKTYSDQERFNLVSRFRKLDIYDIANKKIGENKKECKNEIESLRYKLNSLLSLIDSTFSLTNVDKEINDSEFNQELIQKDLKEAKKSLELNKRHQELNISLTREKGKLETIKSDVDNFTNSLTKVSQTLNENNKEIEKLGKQILKIPDETISDLEIEISTLTKEYENIFGEQKDLESSIKINQQTIKNIESVESLICPSCKKKLSLDENILIIYDEEISKTGVQTNINLINKKRISHGKCLKKIEELKIKLGELKNKKDEIYTRSIKKSNLSTTKINKEQENRRLLKEYDEYLILDLKKNEYSVNKVCFELNQYGEYITQLEVIKKIETELDSLQFIEFNQEQYQALNVEWNNLELNILKLKEYKKQQSNFIAQKDKLESQINDLQEDLNKYTFWIINFEKLKGIELLETEPLLEIVANKILEKMGTNINISFHVDLENKGIGINLIEDSGIERLLELFSQGQSNRISIASGLALKELASTNINFGLSLWDEVLEGLDNTGIEMFFNVLNDIKGMKFVISHNNDLKNYFQNKILITRKNNKSSISII